MKSLQLGGDEHLVPDRCRILAFVGYAHRRGSDARSLIRIGRGRRQRPIMPPPTGSESSCRLMEPMERSSRPWELRLWISPEVPQGIVSSPRLY